MGISPIKTLTLTLAVVVFLSPLPLTSPENLYTLVYKGCATSRGGGVGGASPQAIAALSSSLISQSTSARFYKTTTSAGGQSVSGVFQCRGDVSPADCSSCVSQAIPSWSAQCGPSSPAARVQLVGCYALYQASGFPQVSGTQMLYKTCSSSNAAGDFDVRRGTALSALQNGISGGSGFYATSFGGVYAMAQCEGDLSSADCAECASQAVQRVEVECGAANSGQVYLDKCYVSYSYYPNGSPHSGSGGVGQQTGKTVAIVVGGAAGLGFLVICLLFANSLRGKNDDY